MIRRAALATVLTALALASTGEVAAVAAQGAGSSATTVLRIPPGPRPLALGNAFVAVRDVWAVDYNPASADDGQLALAAAYQTLPVGVSAGAVALAAPLRPGLGLVISTRFVDYGEVDVIEPDPTLPVGHPTGGTASGGELTALVGLVLRRGPVSVGVAGRWLRLDVAGLTDQAVAADLGAALSLTPWLELGAAVQNLGGELEAGRAAPLPRTLRAGASIRRGAGPVTALAAIEARRREAATGVGGGVEVSGGAGSVRAIARVGYEGRPGAGDAYAPLVFGGGVRVDRIAVDLAYRALGPLGSTRQVGITYRF
jgi:hypothetical protein